MAYMPGFGTPEDQLKITEAERRRKFADALRNQQQPQGQMIGQVYVAPSWTQRLATLLQNYQGGQMGRQADQEIKDVAANRQKTMTDANQALIEALKPKQQQVGETSTLPAYTPEQMDRFGSPMQGVQRQPVVTPQFKTMAPTADDRFNALAQFYQQTGNSEGLANLTAQRAQYDLARGDKLADRADDRQYEGTIYDRNRKDTLQDINDKREYDRIVDKEKFGQQLTLQERQFAQQYSMQKNQQGFQAQLQKNNQEFTAKENALTRQKSSEAAALKNSQFQTPEQKENARISAQQVLDQASKVFQHEGRAMGTGTSSFMGAIPGTDAKGFSANLETLKAQTFLPMVQALKGMGSLSNAEGQQLTNAVGALDPSMPEKEFEQSLKDVTRTLYSKAKASGLDVTLPPFATETGASGGWSITPVGK